MSKTRKIPIEDNLRYVPGRVVRGYELPYVANEVECFEGAEPLSLEIADGRVIMWALVDLRRRRDDLRVLVVGSMQPLEPLLCEIPDAGELSYVGMVRSRDPADLSYHVFTVGRKT